MKTEISGQTKVCGIFGCPVGHSLSPAMHNDAFEALELDYIYVPFPVVPGKLPQAVEAVRALEMAGVNVTVPHKEAVLPLLDELSEAAVLIGAVNTIVNRSGRLYGDNTDGRGFLSALEVGADFLPAGKTALVLGAGGAARAVAVQLALAGARRLIIANRTPGRALELASFLNKKTGVETAAAPWPGSRDKGFGLSISLEEAVASASLIVQATSLGLQHDADWSGLPFDRMRPEQVACDLVYKPIETSFLKAVRQTGVIVINGLGMLLYQGVLAFEMWTGAAAPVSVMQNALNKRG